MRAFSRALASMAIVLAGLWVLPPGAEGRPHAGTAVRSFGRAGIVTRGFGAQPGALRDPRLATTPDGKTLVLVNTYQGYTLSRFDANGGVDPTFGEVGFRSGDFGAPLNHPEASTMAVQPDGKILVIGDREERHAGFGGRRTVIARYTANGALDPSFGRSGLATIARTIKLGSNASLAILPEGRLLLLEVIETKQKRQVLELDRLDSNGRLDRTYGNDGSVRIPTPDDCPGVDVANQGSILTLMCLGDTPGNPNRKQLVLWRLDSNGAVDPSFGGGDGVVTCPQIEEQPRFVLASDGGIVAFGSYRRILRLLPDGTPDPAFGSDGLLTLDLEHVDLPQIQISALAVAPDGDILLAGDRAKVPTSADPREAVLARLTPGGELDPAFGGGDGILATNLPEPSNAHSTAVIAIADGRILLVGEAGTDWSNQSILLAQYESDGDLDPGFGSGGLSLTRPMVPGEGAAADLLTDRRGRLVATGPASDRAGVSRFLPSGRPDPAFGEGGFATIPTDGSSTEERGESLARTTGGRILVGVGSQSGGGVLARLLADGRPDPRFGGGGIAPTPALEHVLDLKVTRDGILATGTKNLEEGTEIVLARFHLNGSPDLSFGERGAVVVRPVIGARKPHDLALAIQRSGEILVAGNAEESFIDAFSSAGRRIESFGREGEISLGGPALRKARVRALAVDPDGRILVGGSIARQFGIARLEPGGRLDRTFGNGGSVVTRLGATDSEIAEMRLEPDGDIVAAGRARRACAEDVGYCAIERAVVARYRSDGALDRTFGRRGVWARLVGDSSELAAISLGPGSVDVGGSTLRSPGGRALLLARLHR